MTETITPEGEIVSAELVPVESTTLFQTNDPLEVLRVVQDMARPLGELIREKGMTTRIKGNEHTNIEGWQTLGAMLGVSAHTVWSRPLQDGSGWEARAEARTKAGEVVGSAEGMVQNSERNWRGATDQSMRSMAQTRAQSKALAAPLRFVMALTGMSGTPAEEAPPEPSEPPGRPEWARNVPEDEVLELADQLVDLVGALGGDTGIVPVLGQSIFDAANGVPNLVANVVSALHAQIRPSPEDPPEDPPNGHVTEEPPPKTTPDSAPEPSTGGSESESESDS